MKKNNPHYAKLQVVKNNWNTLLFIGVVLFFMMQLGAQNQRLKVKFSPYQQTLTKEGKLVFNRDDSNQVNFLYDDIELWCDKAIYYTDQDFFEAYGKVKLIQGDTIQMVAKYIEYSGNTLLAYARGNVELTEPSSILQTDTLYFDRKRQQAFYNTKGKVVRDTTATITSQIGRYYIHDKKYQFLNNVVLTNPEYQLNTNHLDYFPDTGHAYMYKASTITGQQGDIYTERGFYNTLTHRGYFVKNSKINYESRVIEGDSMYYDRNRNFASATNHIKVTDSLNKSVFTGHYAEVYRAKDSVFITQKALAATLQEKDSIFIHSDTIMVTGKPEHRIIRAFHNSNIYKSDLAGKADSIHVDQSKGLAKLINLKKWDKNFDTKQRRRPVLWNFKNQMTGDTIHLIFDTKTEKMDTLKVFNSAFLVSKDSLGSGFNQIKGKILIGKFLDNKLNTVHINKNAESVYFARNDENELVGIEKALSGRMSILLENNEIIELQSFKNAKSELYPEEDFPPRYEKLKGFEWREKDRPLSKKDLFKDDPPLKLTQIEGLTAGIPEPVFFDEEIKERIKNAKQNIPENQKNKAAQILPKKKTQPLKVIPQKKINFDKQQRQLLKKRIQSKKSAKNDS